MGRNEKRQFCVSLRHKKIVGEKSCVLYNTAPRDTLKKRKRRKIRWFVAVLYKMALTDNTNLLTNQNNSIQSINTELNNINTSITNINYDFNTKQIKIDLNYTNMLNINSIISNHTSSLTSFSSDIYAN
jgi:hypothetical protein